MRDTSTLYALRFTCHEIILYIFNNLIPIHQLFLPRGAVIDLYLALVQTFIPDNYLQREPDKVGILEFYARGFLAIVQQNFDAFFFEFAVDLFGFS